MRRRWRRRFDPVSNGQTATSTCTGAYRLSFEPGTLATMVTAGTTLSLAVKVSSDRVIDGLVNVEVVDAAGVCLSASDAAPQRHSHRPTDRIRPPYPHLLRSSL
jgi:hypothetical protein